MSLSTEEILDVLANVRRRTIIDVFAVDRECTIGDLAEIIAADENNCSRDQLTSDQRKRVYISLYQVHLGTLDEAGIVGWDKDRGTVTRGPAHDHALATLEAVETGERPTTQGPVSKLRALFGGAADV